MGVIILAQVTCDLCSGTIVDEDQFVNASTYGITAHASCFSNLNPYQVLRLLYLDDITFGRRGEYDAATRVWIGEHKKAITLPGASLEGVKG